MVLGRAARGPFRRHPWTRAAILPILFRVRAIRFDGESVRLATNAPDPALPPGEALVHPTRLLIGEADIAALRAGAGSARFTGVIGHQFVGVVQKVNGGGLGPRGGVLAAARSELLGRRVVGSPAVVCANCDMCRAGLPLHCRARRVMGLHARDGCFADLFAIPLSSLVAVPDAVADDVAVFAHAAAGAAQAAQMLRAASRHYITVIGDNAQALIAAQIFARQNKCTRLLYSRPDRARLCERWGVRHRAIEEPGRRQDQDVVIDCTGAPAGLRLALQLVRPRGVVLLKNPGAGAPFPPGQPFAESSIWVGAQSDGPVDLTPAAINEVQILGCREATIADGLGVLMDGAIDVTSLITQRIDLDDVPEALSVAASTDRARACWSQHAAVVIDV